MRQLDMEYIGGGDSREFVYEFLYCYCIYESTFGTMSLHKTLRGAYNAMKEHKLKNFWEWRNKPNQYRKGFIDTYSQDWKVVKTEIKP